MPEITPVSKREAIAALQELIEYARKARVAFADLASRCQILEASITYDKTDPLREDQLKRFDTVVSDWEKTVKDMLA